MLPSFRWRRGLLGAKGFSNNCRRPSLQLLSRATPGGGLDKRKSSSYNHIVLIRHGVEEAGGHPAELVIVPRLARLYARDSSRWKSVHTEFLSSQAGELAESIYPETWALFGSQQEAFLWDSRTAPKPLSAGALAEAIAPQPSQVSAQIRHLVDEGLLSAAARRAHFIAAPLLARWSAVRAARGRQSNRDLEGVEDVLGQLRCSRIGN